MIIDRTSPTFTAYAENIAPAVNAHILTILNRNTARVIRVWKVNFYVSSEAAVAGVLCKLRLSRITSLVALSGGAAITPTLHDNNDTLSATIDTRTLPSNVITVVSHYRIALISSDEAVVTTFDEDSEASEHFPREGTVLYKADIDSSKPIVLRTDGTTHQGLTIQNLVGAVGNIGAYIEFTDDAN